MARPSSWSPVAISLGSFPPSAKPAAHPRVSCLTSSILLLSCTRGTLPALDPPQQDSPGSPAHLHCALPMTSLHAVGKPQPPVCKANNRTYAQGLRIRTWACLGVGRESALLGTGGLQNSFLDPPPLGQSVVSVHMGWGVAEREDAGLSSGMSPRAGHLLGLVRLLRGHREDDEGKIGR